MTYKEIYEMGKAALEKAGIEEAALDARLLLEFVCNTDRSYLFVHGDESVSEEKEKNYVNYIAKRADHIPLQHLTGSQEFMGLSFMVNDKVLIPRQDTEILVEEVMLHLHDGMSILDVCTGSGCILLSLLKYSNDCKGIGLDISREALCVARENMKRLGLSAKFWESDLFSALEAFRSSEESDGELASEAQLLSEAQPPSDSMYGRKFDMIVSNPPYIETQVVETLALEVKEHEPRLALDGGKDGLDFYRRITAQAGVHLNRGGMLFFEIGYNQGKAVSDILEEAGFVDVQVKKDLSGLDRVVFGTFLEEKHV